MYTFYNQVLEPVFKNINSFAERNAFFINEKYYTYKVFGQKIATIRNLLQSKNYSNNKVGLVINDDIETYASIFALWLEGNCYVPLHPKWPIGRCNDILEQVGIDLILDSTSESRFNPLLTLNTKKKVNDYSADLDPIYRVSDNEIAYILFTSGSTGKPKGVPINRRNLSAFISSFYDIGFQVCSEDRVLQCFDLSFDLSVISYLIPLLNGACVYTVPIDVVKYMKIYELLEDKSLTFALMAPSTIIYLRPYFDEINLPELRYCLFCGEALREDVTTEWADCIPNARIFNVYGPTEDTIFCTYYEYRRTNNNKNHNGILSIGKTMTSGTVKIFDENMNETSVGELGELLLSGNQLFTGYWKNDVKTKEVFIQGNDGITYYKSGDLCYRDEDGDIMYSGRIDHQAKIQGFRVEMGEIEWNAREFLGGKNVVCLAFDNKESITEIAMFIESKEFNTIKLINYLREKMPSYMIPTKILFVPVFPLNTNDKIDKVKLKEMI